MARTQLVCFHVIAKMSLIRVTRKQAAVLLAVEMDHQNNKVLGGVDTGVELVSVLWVEFYFETNNIHYFRLQSTIWNCSYYQLFFIIFSYNINITTFI